MNRKQLYAKVLLNLLAHPLTLFPFVAGATVLMATLLGVFARTAIFTFAGLALLLVSVGALATRLLTSLDSVVRQVMSEMEKEHIAAREAELDQLNRELSRDRDRRDEALLADLRSINHGFQESYKVFEDLRANAKMEIYNKAQELFGMCVTSLKKSLQLLRLDQEVNTPEVKKEIQRRRERILDEVRDSVKQLSRILVGLQQLSSGEEATSEIAELHRELDQGLAIARRVDERMRGLTGINIRETE